MAPQESLKISIVGGGLAGLLTARFLREHHQVTIFEKNSTNSEVGAGLSLGPTAVRILNDIGFDRARVGAVSGNSTRLFTPQGKQFSQLFNDSILKTGYDRWLIHRIKLWWEFHRLATTPSSELGIGGQPAKLEFDSEVTAIDVDSGVLTLKNGRTVESDLIVCAEGITSTCRSTILGQDDKFGAPAGTSAFRFVLPAEIMQDLYPETDVLDQTRDSSIDVYVPADGSMRSIVLYPVNDYQALNFVCIVADQMVPTETYTSWTAEGKREDLLNCYKDFCPFVTDLLARATEVKLWRLRDFDPLPTYIRGCAIIIGDSSHSMTPHGAMGATVCVEDAEAFSLFNDPGVTRDSIPEIIQKIDSVRRPRASRIQLGSRQSQTRESKEDFEAHLRFNMTYPGIKESLAQMKHGE